jgi:signal peptidase I
MTRARLWAEFRSWVLTFALVWLCTGFFASGVGVDGVSMLPGLRHGEFLLIPKAEGWAHRLGLGQYGRGDIVVFKPPLSAGDTVDTFRGVRLPWRYRPYLVKRVVGLPGDTVQLRGGVVYLNGVAQPDPAHADWVRRGCLDKLSALANTAPVQVGPGQLFVMGDNRSPGGSLDSRSFGPVGLNDVAGRAVLSLWPLMVSAQASVPCGGADAKNHVTGSGPLVWNVRGLVGR